MLATSKPITGMVHGWSVKKKLITEEREFMIAGPTDTKVQSSEWRQKISLRRKPSIQLTRERISSQSMDCCLHSELRTQNLELVTTTDGRACAGCGGSFASTTRLTSCG